MNKYFLMTLLVSASFLSMNALDTKLPEGSLTGYGLLNSRPSASTSFAGRAGCAVRQIGLTINPLNYTPAQVGLMTLFAAAAGKTAYKLGNQYVAPKVSSFVQSSESLKNKITPDTTFKLTNSTSVLAAATLGAWAGYKTAHFFGW